MTFTAYGTRDKDLPARATVSYYHAERFAKEQNGWVENADGHIIYGKKPAGTIDLTPTWLGTLPLLLETYASGTDKGRAMALAELQNMAKLADTYNASLPR
jgi:hypothetical protein